MSEKITEQDFFKSLERLEAMAKGGAEEDIEKSQICTGPGHEPQTWPGGDKTEMGDGWDDSIQPDGTDYNGPGSAARKSIAEKVFKGEPLTPQEIMLLKGDYDGEISKAKKKKDKKKDEEEEMMEGKEMPFEMGKSFEDSVQESETLQKGIEVSEFLAELTKSIGIGLDHVKQAVVNEVTANIFGGLEQFYSEQTDFNKSLAEAVVGIGHGVHAQSEAVEQVAQEPAGPPKSQLRAIPGGQQPQPLQKGMEPPPEGGEQLDKAMVLDVMSDLVEKGQLNSLEVIKFESTGEISDRTQNLVMKSMGQ